MSEIAKHDEHKPDKALVADPHTTDARHAEAGKDEKLNALITATVSGLHSSARNIEIKELHSISNGLYIAEIDFTPAAGVSQKTEVLLYVSGEKCFIFGGR